ncbi:hypothetical protein [Cellulomonas sp. KRMCY2]|uniref:hypothetical protein n=1 Tax=Cellulomonas sp. KRMCY2 TaxID=1304865 RepID=UPI00045E72AB|nr:hypothetical protein [Cellulomonas sp. KRMCY2]
MRTSIKLLGALAAAGLVAAGGSALTANNTGVEAANVGYQSAVISGVTVSNVEYVVDPLDASMLSEIVFTEAPDVSAGHLAILTVNGPTQTQITCDTSVALTITCLTPSLVISTITSIALTVTTI